MQAALIILGIMAAIFVGLGGGSYKPKPKLYGLGFWGGLVIIIINFFEFSIIKAILLGLVIFILALILLFGLPAMRMIDYINRLHKGKK